MGLNKFINIMSGTRKRLYLKIVGLSVSVFLMSLALVPIIEFRLGIEQYDEMRQITGLMAMIGALHFGYYDGIIFRYKEQGEFLSIKNENLLVIILTSFLSILFMYTINITYFESFVIVFCVFYGSRVAVNFSVNSKDYYQSYTNAITLLLILSGCFFFNDIIKVLILAQVAITFLRYFLVRSLKEKRVPKELDLFYFIRQGFPIYLSGFLMIMMLNYERVLLPIVQEDSAIYSISNTLATSSIGIIAVLGTRLFIDFDEGRISKIVPYVTALSLCTILVICYLILSGGYHIIFGYKFYYGPLLLLSYSIEWVLLWLPILRRRRKNIVFFVMNLTILMISLFAVFLGKYDFVLSAIIIRLAMQACSFLWFKEVVNSNMILLAATCILMLVKVYVADTI